MLDEDSASDVTMAFAVKFYNPLVKYNGRLLLVIEWNTKEARSKVVSLKDSGKVGSRNTLGRMYLIFRDGCVSMYRIFSNRKKPAFKNNEVIIVRNT